MGSDHDMYLLVQHVHQLRCMCTLKELTSQSNSNLVNLSSKTYVFEDKMTMFFFFFFFLLLPIPWYALNSVDYHQWGARWE